ncbi:MAG: MerR family transcriptional regulator, partial [Clostridiales bacterium]|nr:MerR family transcriptional regulator [Clostridiales bacterium]
LITNVEKTIEALEGRIVMGDKEKFEGFKKNIVEENERKYGMEIREKYGDNAVDKSNKKMLNMTEEEYAEFEKLSQEIFVTLEKAFATGNPAGELGEKLAKLHKKWLSYTWGEYNKDAHRGLAQMYVDDQRFTAYYDNKKPGMAKFLRDAIFAYTDKLEE